MVRTETRSPSLACGTLVVGAIAHALLCGPAIGCRGYPPIAPIWYGVTYIWPVAILISAYFDSIQFGTRRIHLMTYSLVTAFFTAGTVVMVVPRSMGPVEMLFGTVLFGPVHLAVATVLELLVQSFYSTGRQLVEPKHNLKKLNFSLFSFLCMFGWIALLLGIPFGYQSFVESSINRSAVERAEENWSTNAFIFQDFQLESTDEGDLFIQYDFDPETGLEYKRRTSDLGYSDRYNARIRELIERDGLPKYSIKTIMPSATDLVQFLDSTSMDLVESFPTDLTRNIHLMRRGSLSRWGGTSTNGSDSLSIVTPHAHAGSGGGIFPVHAKITTDIVYIRNGADWIGAFLPDGRMVMSATRFP